jgi:CubicO group peptidase (beta-lactamase class C family)
MKKFLCVFVVYLLINSPFVFCQTANKMETGKKADTYLSRLEPFGFSGTVLIATGDEVILNRGYGYAVPSQKIPNTSETVFSLGSIVKPFTATLIMKLVQDGSLELHDTLAEFFPDAPADKQQITIYNLLSHGSGLPGAIGMDSQYISKTDYIDEVWRLTLESEPGARYRYSNVGFTLLAMIIEELTGATYEQYLHETILKPAGMTQTGYTMPSWKSRNLAHNISNGKDHGPFTGRTHYPTWHLIGNGGMLSTTSDMHRFYLFMRSDRLLSDKTKELMWKPVFMEDALGWVNVDDGEILQYNGGSMDGNGALMKWYPKDDMFLMVFTNQTMEGKPGFVVVEQPLERLIFNQNIAMPPEITVYKEADLTAIEGLYESDQHQVFQFVKDGNELLLQPKNQQALNMLFAVHQNSAYLTEEWNTKIERIISKAVEMKDFSDLKEISRNPESMQDMILNELEMEGYSNPRARVLYSQEIVGGSTKTLVAVSEQDFEGECMLFHLVFQEGFNVGFGVDFGHAELPGIRLIQTGKNSFAAFDLDTGQSLSLSLKPTNDENSYEMKIEDKSIVVHKVN